MRLNSALPATFVIVSALLAGAPARAAVQQDRIVQLATQLEQQATAAARDSYEHFKGWNGVISDDEQAILFKSEAFAASCRLFLRFIQGDPQFLNSEHVRTNLYNAFTYLAASFSDLEQAMRSGNVIPYSMRDCRNILARMDREFAGWKSPENPAYLEGKYVRATDATVYLIEKRGVGRYVKRAFTSMESLFRYNYDANRGKDPWKYFIQVPEDTLRRMPTESPIALTFEGKMIIEASARPGRAVYKIENGKRRPLPSPDVVIRLGGWNLVFEVPREVVDSYKDGEPIR